MVIKASATRPRDHGEVVRRPGRQEWQDDWVDGKPPFITEATLAIDLRIYKHAKCPKCGRRGLKVKPQTNRGSGHYRILASCPECKAETHF
jgi:transposase-like protein